MTSVAPAVESEGLQYFAEVVKAKPFYFVGDELTYIIHVSNKTDMPIHFEVFVDLHIGDLGGFEEKSQLAGDCPPDKRRDFSVGPLRLGYEGRGTIALNVPKQHSKVVLANFRVLERDVYEAERKERRNQWIVIVAVGTATLVASVVGVLVGLRII